MRLQLSALTVLIGLVVPGSGVGAGLEEIGTRVDVYSDRWMRIISQSNRAAVQATESLEVEGRYAVDALTGATHVLAVDAVTSATKLEETRHQGDLGVSYAPSATTTVGANFVVSYEPDYLTQVIGVSFGQELLGRSAILDGSYNLSFERVGHSGDDDYAQRALGHMLDVSWTQIIDRNTQVVATLVGHANRCGGRLGCHANPYRYVLVAADGANLALPERHPRDRYRSALGLKAARALGKSYAAHGGYRYYHDSWQVRGHTADAALSFSGFAERLVLRAAGRASWQTAASFFRDDYSLPDDLVVPRYRTVDRELAGVQHGSLSLRAEWSVSDVWLFRRLTANARASRLWYRYPEHSELPRRRAWLFGIGLGAEL